MSDTPQKRALRNYRSRLARRGMARFEVLGLDSDRDLIRSLAKHLAEESPKARRIRTALRRSIVGTSLGKGGIVAALRRSPLVSAELDLMRRRETGREIEL